MTDLSLKLATDDILSIAEKYHPDERERRVADVLHNFMRGVIATTLDMNAQAMVQQASAAFDPPMESMPYGEDSLNAMAAAKFGPICLQGFLMGFASKIIESHVPADTFNQLDREEAEQEIANQRAAADRACERTELALKMHRQELTRATEQAKIAGEFFDEIKRLQEENHSLREALAKRHNSDEVEMLRRNLGHLQSELARRGGYTINGESA